MQIKSSCGYTIIELMIAASLGVIIVTAIHSIASKTVWIVEEIKASGELLENAQYLVGLLSRDISLAGFYGDFNYPNTTTMVPTDICESMDKKKIRQAMPFFVTGINDAARGDRICGGEVLLSGTDIILLRQSSVIKQSPKKKLESKQFYLQGALGEFKLGRGDNPSVFSLRQGSEIAPVRVWQQTIYYVSKDNVFKRRRFLKGKYSGAEPLVDGVYDFQIEYAIRPSFSSIHCNPQQTIDYLSPPLKAEQWQQVVAVRFYFLLRSSWQGVDQAGKVFQYAGKSYAVEGGGHYALFSGIAAIMNSIPKRVEFNVEI